MIALRGIIQHGQVVLQSPAELPDGTEVTVLAVGRETPADEPLGPEEIAGILAWMDQFEPLEFSEEERAALDADRQARKAWEKAHFDEHADKLRSMWP